VRERGVQSRRPRPDSVEPYGRPGPTRGGRNFWQPLAIAALIAATAGWTTVAVLALREPATAAVVTPSDSADPNATQDPSVPPAADTHDVPDLEALLPTAVNGTALQLQSWNGGGILTDDAWSTSMTAFLKGAGKTAADLQVAQAYDPNQALDGSFGVYRVVGLATTSVHDALLAAWKGDYPDMKVSQLTLDGKAVTKADFGQDTPSSYLYQHGDVVYDIETTDEKVASAALAAIPTPGAAASPRTSAAPASPAASASPKK
jgi:hypothetical protein